MRENILVSACLLGEKCRYDGKDCLVHGIEKLKVKYNLIPICPEVLGGLTTPRNPAEQKFDKVFDNKGNDVTDAFMSGAKRCLEIAKKHNCKIAILKSKSPACGFGQVFDGTFSGRLIDGNGFTAKLLLEHEIEIYTEKCLNFL